MIKFYLWEEDLDNMIYDLGFIKYLFKDFN